MGSVLLAPATAFAYMDPGTGGMLLQMLIGGIVAALYTLKLYWQRVRNFLSGSTDGKTPNPADDKGERRSGSEEG